MGKVEIDAISFLILVLFIAWIFSGDSGRGGGVRVNNEPKTPKPPLPKPWGDRKKEGD